MSEAIRDIETDSQGESRMNLHRNARLTPKGRAILVRRMVEEGLRAEEAAQASGVSVRTAYKWLARYRSQGLGGLQDRSSRPHHSPLRTDDRRRATVRALRRSRRREISWITGVAHSTVGRIVQQAGLNRLAHLEPPPRTSGNRQSASGILPGAGWEYVHVAIDDHSRISFAGI